MKILVTGGAGYIGSYMTRLLLRNNFDVVVLDDLSRGDRRAVQDAQLIVGSVSDPHTLDSLFRLYSIDAVIHFAAFIDVGESVAQPLLYYKNNTAGTLSLLEGMVRNGVQRLIFSSTAAIFGLAENQPVKEDAPCAPINPYGASKWMVERFLSDMAHKDFLHYCSLRYFNVAGADPEGRLPIYNTKQHNLIPVILRAVRENQPVTIFGDDYPTTDGTCVRDYIHVHDLCAAHLLALQYLRDKQPSTSFNLGNGRGFSVQEVINAARQTLNCEIKTEIGSRRPGDPPILVCDSEKAQSILKWNPNYPDLSSMITHAWQATASFHQAGKF